MARLTPAEVRLRRRYREERRFRAYGVAAIGFALLSLCVLIVSIVREATSAFTKHEISLDLLLDPAIIDPAGDRDPEQIRSNVAGFSDLIRGELRSAFPEAAGDPATRRQLYRLVSTLSGQAIAEEVADDPSAIGDRRRIHAPVSDVADLYLKGLVTDINETTPETAASLARGADGVRIDAPDAFAAAYGEVAGFLLAEAERAEDAAAAAAETLGARRAALALAEQATARIDGASPEGLEAEAGGRLAGAAPEELSLARAAGAVFAGAAPAELRAAVAAEAMERSRAAAAEAEALLERAERFRRRQLEAEAAGEPSAETRRIQAETALLAHDRRRVDALIASRAAERAATMGPEELLSEASLLVGRPLAPFGRLAGARSGEERLVAISEINRFERLAASAAVREQTFRIAALEAEAAALGRIAAERAEALAEGGVEPARSRLKRLQRDLEALEASALRLQGMTQPASPSPGAAPAAGGAGTDAAAEDAAFLEREAAAQAGSDFGGAPALAFALSAAGAGLPAGQEELRALLGAMARMEASDIREDIARQERRRVRFSAEAEARRAAAGAGEILLSEFTPSVLVTVGGGALKAVSLSRDHAVGRELIPVQGPPAAGEWRIRTLATPEADRLITDQQAVWADTLKADGRIVKRLNTGLITHADSTYPELAGLAAGLAGSFWIMVVTLILSMPLGVMAAIYLEEFAPRNRLTDFIEVNINNLAAVPSIVFGLLGAAVFINFFELPRSAPFVGGLVLSLITLPTIIIATRAAIGAVPPSIREGALAVGASLPQTVFHHVLPLAMPGILTGAIIGLARALGETAPLLLIGMVAFVAEPPEGMFDSATALPVLVYKWSAAAERAWQPMTSAAIIVLLAFMFTMNALAVYLRRRLERRW